MAEQLALAEAATPKEATSDVANETAGSPPALEGPPTWRQRAATAKTKASLTCVCVYVCVYVCVCVCMCVRTAVCCPRQLLGRCRRLGSD